MKWVLKHRSNLKKAMASLDYSYQPDDGGACWSFDDINYYDRFPEEKHGDNRHEDGSGDDKAPVKPKITDHFYITILGLHPFKETVYLSNYYCMGLAYYLDSSKVQYLGNMCPKLYGVIAGQHADIQTSFPYTPCWRIYLESVWLPGEGDVWFHLLNFSRCHIGCYMGCRMVCLNTNKKTNYRSP